MRYSTIRSMIRYLSSSHITPTLSQLGKPHYISPRYIISTMSQPTNPCQSKQVSSFDLTQSRIIPTTGFCLLLIYVISGRSHNRTKNRHLYEEWNKTSPICLPRFYILAKSSHIRTDAMSAYSHAECIVLSHWEIKTPTQWHYILFSHIIITLS